MQNTLTGCRNHVLAHESSTYEARTTYLVCASRNHDAQQDCYPYWAVE